MFSFVIVCLASSIIVYNILEKNKMKGIGNCVVPLLYVAILFITLALVIRYKIFTSIYKTAFIFLAEALVFTLFSISFDKLRNIFHHSTSDEFHADKMANKVEEMENEQKYVS